MLILDNTFGEISTKDALVPMFEMAKRANVQLICFSDITKCDITSCFSNIVKASVKSSRFSSWAYIIIDEEVKEVYWNDRFIIAKSNIEGDKKWYIVEFGPGGGPCVVHTYSDYDQFIGAGRSFSLDTLKMEHLVWKD